MIIEYFVAGTPRTQGSLKGYVVKSKETGQARAILTHDNKPELRDWRATVRQVTADHVDEPITGPVELRVQFHLERPRSRLKMRFPDVKPDLDKLTRAVMDALKGIAYHDDNQVVGLVVSKIYALPSEGTGAWITIGRAGDE